MTTDPAASDEIVAAKAFRFGYFGSARPPGGATDVLAGWRQVKVGGWSFWLHPELHWGISERRGSTVLIVGEAIDLAAGDSDEKAIAARAAKELKSSGLQAAIRYVAYLGGRFACFISDRERLIAIPDDHGMQPIFWTQGAVSSHAPLIAEAVGAGPDEKSLALLDEILEAREKGLLYHPATLTPFENVHLLLPNHLLSVDLTGSPSVERFYPFSDTQLDEDPQSAYETFSELFLAHTRHICAYRRVGVALTAGWDSRTCLAAARRFIQKNRGFTFTYQDFANPQKGTMKDLFGANALAFKLRLPHRDPGAR